MNGTKFRTFYKLKINKATIIFVLILFPVLCSGSLHKTHYIALNQLYVDVTSMSVLPGDTILIEAGKRKSLKILNVKGDSLNYIVIRNDGGDVIVENDDFHYGFSLSNCSYFRLTGNYKNESVYGIKILQTGNGASGLSFDNLTTN